MKVTKRLKKLLPTSARRSVHSEAFTSSHCDNCNEERVITDLPTQVSQGVPAAGGTIATIGVFTEEMLRLNNAVAKRLEVDAAVHPDDYLYWFLVANPGHPSLEIPINHYFEDGRRCAYKFAEIVSELGFEPGRQINVLEFASGYGLVSRHLKRYPQFDLVCCDIHANAIEFLKDQIGVKTLLSASVPEEFSALERYDVVFALSSFSHMPKSTSGRWLLAAL